MSLPQPMQPKRVTKRQKDHHAQVSAQYFSTGVAALLRIAPYYATLIGQLVRRPVNKPGLTMAVSADGFLFYSPEWLKTLTVPQVATVIEHELLHVLMRTFERGKVIGVTSPHEHKIWNFATDCANNEALKAAAGREVMSNWLLPETFGIKPKQTAEIYYGELLKQFPPQGGACESGASGNGKHQDGTNPQDEGEGEGPGTGQCGSCGGKPHEVEGDAEIRGKARGRTPLELDLARRQVAREVDQAQRTRGDVPANLVRWATEALAPPKINWRMKLARLVRANAARAIGASDFDWSRNSRRQAGMGYGPGRAILPAYMHRIPRVAVIVDTSGSMSQTDLADAASEVDGITQAIGAEVEFISVDAAVHVVTKVRNAREAIKNMRGGGGTDMKPAITELVDRPRTKRPDIAICLTDGFIGEIGAQPPFAFVWATIGNENGRNYDHSEFRFAWGDHVIVERVAKK